MSHQDWASERANDIDGGRQTQTQHHRALLFLFILGDVLGAGIYALLAVGAVLYVVARAATRRDEPVAV